MSRINKFTNIKKRTAMKNLFLSFILIASLLPLNVSYAGTIPVADIPVIEIPVSIIPVLNIPVLESEFFTIESINFEMDRSLVVDYGMEITFNEKNGNLAITLNEEVSFLQVMNEQETLEFQLPVFSKSVILDLDDFQSGNYKMNILMNNESVIPAKFRK